jgi:GTP-binding protein HflX
MLPTSCSPLWTRPRAGCYIEGAGPIVLSDTVGFIRDLPHALVAAFQATLEETAQADLLLHVVDSASGDRDQQIQAVDEVWVRSGRSTCRRSGVEQDRCTAASPGIERDDCGKINRVRVSAHTGEGLDLLREALPKWRARITYPAAAPDP